MAVVNYRLKAQLLQVVDNQLNANDPKCTKRAFIRLMGLGYTRDESREMIASVLVEEIFDVGKNKKPYNEKQYCKKLEKLPEYVEEQYENLESEENVPIPVVKELNIGRNAPCPW